MKKFILTLAVMIATLMNVSADTYSNYNGETKFFDNWSIGVEGGVQTNLHDWNKPQGGIAGITLNKQIVPAFGLSLEGYAGFNNTGNWFSVNDRTYHVHNMLGVDNVQAYLTGRWNLMNSFGGYTGKLRVFEIETNVGFGYGHFFFHDNADFGALLGKAGLNFNFNLGKERAWTISLKPAVVWNFTQAPERYYDIARNQFAVFQGTAGVTYHFGTSNGTHHITASPVPELVATIDGLNTEVNNLRAKVAELEAKEADTTVIAAVTTVVETDTVIKKELVQSTYVVTFAFNSDTLTDSAKETLNQIPVGSSVKIVAYASPEGNKTYNMTLSDRRAVAICDYLMNRDVMVVSSEGLGVDGNASNRIGIITVIE